MNVLVTGGAGYIGSVTVHELSSKGHSIVVADNCAVEKFRHVQDVAEVEQGDLTDKHFTSSLFQKHKIDAVIHMASLIEISESMKDPLKFYYNNVVGSLNLLHAMHKNNVFKLVYSSSASVYGNPLSIPIEEDHPLQPINHYGHTKASEEHIIHSSKKNGLQPICLRYFNAAGSAYNILESHEPETHLIPLLLNAVHTGKPFNVFGNDYPTKDGTCVRDFVHVRDIAKAHLLSLQALEKGITGSFNLGSGAGYSIQEVIDVAAKVTGLPVTVNYHEKREGDPPILIASNKRASQVLGWKPEHDIHSIIKSVWNMKSSQNI